MLPPHDEWVSGNSAGPYTSTVDKFLIHTTEGGTIEGAVAAYRTNNSWPHLTVDCRFGRRYRRCGHLDLSVSARSLKNMAGGVQTNTDGVVQVEVVGSAKDPSEIDWAWFALNVIEPICVPLMIPCVSPLVWAPYPASYGQNAPQRLSADQWTKYKGILGHQHAPENDHGDPGAIPIALILNSLTEDDMSAEDVKKITDAMAAMEKRIVDQVIGSKPLIVAFNDVNPGEPDHWYMLPARTRSEITRDDARQAVAEGNARWWARDQQGNWIEEPLRVPRETLESAELIPPDV